MRIKVFTHTDLDGIGPVVLLQTLLEAEVDYECHGYGTIDVAVNAYYNDRLFLDYDMTLITDISVRKDFAIEAIRSMDNQGHKIALLDHHPTAEPLNKYLWAKVVTEKPNCGTTLTLDYIKRNFKEEIDGFDPIIIRDAENFANLVSQWDTWLWVKNEDDKPKLLNDLFYIYGREEFLERTVEKLLNANEIITHEDILALKVRQRAIEKCIEQKCKQFMLVDNAYENLTAGVVFAEDYISELGHELLKEYDEAHYVMIINAGSSTVSLRAREDDDIDVEVIAQQYGGGGHKKASGFRFDMDISGNWMMDVIQSNKK